MSEFQIITTRQRAPLSAIDVGDRIREDYGDLPGLMASIKTKGLIQPIVVNPQGKLIAGGRRFFSHVALFELGLEQFSEIDYVCKDTLDESDLREQELEENLKREDLKWYEYALGILMIHRIKCAQSAKIGETWTQSDTGIAIGRTQQRVQQLLPIARALAADPEHKTNIWLCNDLYGAQSYLLEIEEQKAKEELALRSTGAAGISLASKFTAGMFPTGVNKSNTQVGAVILPGSGSVASSGVTGLPLPIATLPPQQETPHLKVNLADFFHHGHCIPWMLQHKGEFHHIITDPPYAIDMANLQQENVGMNVANTIAEHEVQENLALLKDFVQAAYECLPDKGFMALFCDTMNFRFLHDLSVKAGFAVQRWPVVWCKPQAANNAAGYNFTKATEDVIVMRKGAITLIEHQSLNWRMIPRGPQDKDFDHPFAKPAALWEWLIGACTLPGQVVLDAFSGSGSGVCPLIRTGRQWRACEKAPQHVMEFLRNVTKCYQEHLAASKAKIEISYNPTQTNDTETP